MKKIVEFVDMFCKLAEGRKLTNIKGLVGRMFEIDPSLSASSANWNHNLASVFRILVRVSGKPGKLEKILDKFDPEDWIKRGMNSEAWSPVGVTSIAPIKEIEEKDEQLANDIRSTLYLIMLEPETVREELSSPMPQQP